MSALEWQAAEGSRTMHILDTSKPAWKNTDGSRRLVGPRSLCGRYPQRNAEGAWLSWTADENDQAEQIAMHYRLVRCPDCLDLRASVPHVPTPTQGEQP